MSVYPTYTVGEVVHIVKTPMDGTIEGTEECDAGWVDRMSFYCGKEAAIVENPYANRYVIDIDGGDFRWSPDCFQETYGPVVEDIYPDDEEIDSGMEQLLAGLIR